jgi:hypothetical protein
MPTSKNAHSDTGTDNFSVTLHNSKTLPAVAVEVKYKNL